jgi:hypothetical protein
MDHNRMRIPAHDARISKHSVQSLRRPSHSCRFSHLACNLIFVLHSGSNGAGILRFVNGGNTAMAIEYKLGRRAMVGLATLGAIAAAGIAVAADQPSGRVEMEQHQISLVISAGWGHGTLTYQGQQHPFSIHGLGVGGLGVSSFTAGGPVFGLQRLEDFPGAFSQLSAGAVAGNDQLPGGLWLANPHGVKLHLVPHRKGVALSLGADGLLIEFDT